MVSFGVVGFYGRSTIVDYLMSNPFIHILNMHDFKLILLKTFSNESKLIFFSLSVKRFQVLLYITNNSIKHRSLYTVK